MLDLGEGQEKPLSSASVGPCLSPAVGFLGYLNFTFCVTETSKVTVPAWLPLLLRPTVAL